jgi:hypothetical protein
MEWGKQLQAIAQNGLTYTDGVFDRERYKALQAIAAEILATYSNVEPSYVLELFAHEIGYATPKVVVRGAVFRDDTILLVRERADGCWTLPGDGLMLVSLRVKPSSEKCMKSQAMRHAPLSFMALRSQ